MGLKRFLILGTHRKPAGLNIMKIEKVFHGVCESGIIRCYSKICKDSQLPSCGAELWNIAGFLVLPVSTLSLFREDLRGPSFSPNPLSGLSGRRIMPVMS